MKELDYIMNMFGGMLLIVVILSLISFMPTEVSETYKCDSLENGTIIEGKVHDGLVHTTYTLVICDEASIRDDSKNWITVSPNTYSDYEQGKINKIENWEE